MASILRNLNFPREFKEDPLIHMLFSYFQPEKW
jgi:hypothetical protein